MFDRGWRQHMEDRQTALEGSVGNLANEVAGIGGKIDKLVEGMSSTGERVAQRAQAVKAEIRDESDRKAKDRSELFKNGLALAGGVSMIVTALVGPYISQLTTTTKGQQEDTKEISAVREVLAQQGAEIGRAKAGLDVAREKGAQRDEQIRELTKDSAYLQGWLSAKYKYSGK